MLEEEVARLVGYLGLPREYRALELLAQRYARAIDTGESPVDRVGPALHRALKDLINAAPDLDPEDQEAAFRALRVISGGRS